MKKIILYFLAFIGTLAILFFISQWFGRAGTTMYRGSPLPMQAAVGKPDYAVSSVAMRITSQSSGNQPSENVKRGMIIRNANISLQVNNINSAMEKIFQLAENSGGYVVSSNLTQDNDEANNTTANMSIRVPAQGLNNALTALKSLATQVMQESITGEDITQQFVDLQSQLSNLQKAKEQLSKIMASANNTSDVLSVFKQLSDTQGQIDVIQGQIKYFKESVAYSLININLSMNPIIQTEQQKQWKITETFIDSYHALIDQLHHFTYGLITFFVYVLPLLLLWICIFLIIFWIGKKIWNKFKKS
ncbi:DUF4349 domain-containing protein [Legionella qingyii]|uniref:DUF4349 domain-containing protein n=1 Tax=Legionella qingyii TaxID=2184757 RepID=A0A317U9I3_9GAMM|nr:DUF4349 domain-containing protein [Legionella qingyii]PWY57011.1 DUF4349 domain-containing protein [Legionella qingyii]PWY57367.1 DUF4349 domain-containing protein [Legionella qingyii]RUR26456.1 DUF4349 domain-containing protein [Legionella qingyii]RUR27476.1 DUF4349 domain-containing protein [Legionella qingyii]